MKAKILLLSAFLAANCLSAQTFSDDFEGYTVGSSLGPQSATWTTWSGVQGGADDINVGNADAHSGTKSLHFVGAVGGGPADIVLPFSGPHSDGALTFITWFKIPNGKGAYFNTQGTNTIGALYTNNVFFQTTGVLNITNTKGAAINTNYPQGVWFEYKTVANLNTNSWELFIDGVSKGTFQNADYSIASIDYYATDANDEFFVDDVSFVYTPFVKPSLNGAVGYLDIPNGLVGQTRESSITVRNLGNTPITNFAIEMTNNGTTVTQNYTGVNIASGAAYSVIVTNPITLVAGANTITAKITKVNGAATDMYPADDSKTLVLNPTVPGDDKMVVAEEGTGTWCGWCPRGAVALDDMTKNFKGYFQGIAVHNGDPMTVATYDAGMGALISGYPSALVDRLADIDPSNIITDFMTRIQLAPVAKLKNGAAHNTTTGQLVVSVNTTFKSTASGNYKIACVILEDSVKGTEAGYNQANYYAGGNNGVMGGYESLPGTVPASQMQYDHVARAIAPSFAGMPNAYGSSMNAGDNFYHSFEFNVLPWNTNKLHIVSMIIAPDGKIENAKSSTLAEAISNGYSMATGADNVSIKPNFASVYPNPTKGSLNLQINSTSNANANIAILDITGKVITQSTQLIKNGTNLIPMQMHGAAKGNYLVVVNMENQSQTIPFTID